MYSIEWQKRVLPFSYLSVVQKKSLPIKIDNLVSAELLKPDEDSILFENK